MSNSFITSHGDIDLFVFCMKNIVTYLLNKKYTHKATHYCLHFTEAKDTAGHSFYKNPVSSPHVPIFHILGFITWEMVLKAPFIACRTNKVACVTVVVIFATQCMKQSYSQVIVDPHL